MLTELRQVLYLDTPRGPAIAFAVIDYGAQADLIWVCFILESGECWSYPNPVIKLAKNITMGLRV